MKTYTNKITTVLGLLVLSLAMVACGKKSDSSNNVTSNSNGYYVTNNQCYNSQNLAVPNACCSQLTNGIGTQGIGQIINNQCVLNGSVVDMSYCNSNNGYNNGYNNAYNQQCNNAMVPGYNNGQLTQQCFGQYIDIYGVTGTCNGQNCAGYTLRPVANPNTQVRCI